MKKQPRWRTFFWLWLLLSLAFLVTKTGFNWFVFGWIDLRKAALLELLLVPFGQSLIVWLLYRPWRK